MNVHNEQYYCEIAALTQPLGVGGGGGEAGGLAVFPPIGSILLRLFHFVWFEAHVAM